MHDAIADGRLSPTVLRSFTAVAERLHADHPAVPAEAITGGCCSRSLLPTTPTCRRSGPSSPSATCGPS